MARRKVENVSRSGIDIAPMCCVDTAKHEKGCTELIRADQS